MQRKRRCSKRCARAMWPLTQFRRMTNAAKLIRTWNAMRVFSGSSVIAIRTLPLAVCAPTHRSARCANPHRFKLLTTIKTRIMPEPAPIIYIRREREQREVLPVHVVLQIEHARKTCAGDLRLVPRAITLLRRQQIAETTLHTRPVQIAARANSHDGPGRLRSRALALALEDRVLVRCAGFTPAAVVVLTALEPIAPAQDPILRHVLADGAK